MELLLLYSTSLVKDDMSAFHSGLVLWQTGRRREQHP